TTRSRCGSPRPSCCPRSPRRAGTRWCWPMASRVAPNSPSWPTSGRSRCPSCSCDREDDPVAPRQPNVIMVVVDDLGWRDLGCTGSDFYETPHIDALAARGVRFSQAYAAAPNCSPTRASLLTGRAPARVGMTHQAGGHNVGRLCDVPSFRELPRQEFTLARALRSHGYQTWHVGKWHLGGRRSWPDRHGFEVN